MECHRTGKRNGIKWEMSIRLSRQGEIEGTGSAFRDGEREGRESNIHIHTLARLTRATTIGRSAVRSSRCISCRCGGAMLSFLLIE
jgi:hypothetical protein